MNQALLNIQLSKLAQLKKINFEEINKITTNNFNSLFFN